MQDAYIYDGLRTPFGRHGGSLAAIRPDELLGLTLKALVARNPLLQKAMKKCWQVVPTRRVKIRVTWHGTVLSWRACLSR
ncbi:hypothetical protein HSBAA_34790 [Vreelandella sulfidaeris]|uniref:Thiolase N-terminal domain-containing protein n=1 Tax=Vreelandella sulfidaeris TaxID=115553 RepID=A0A455UA79_9GAMM|nr:hypothetical protein HSBAA_34790 [Halomonas sulfidaeris]